MLNGSMKLALFAVLITSYSTLFAQKESPLDQRLDFSANTTDFAGFLTELEELIGIGINYSQLPAGAIESKSYKQQTVRFILEDALRQFGWYYTLHSKKSLVLYPINWNKPGPYSISGIAIDKASGNGMPDIVVYSQFEKRITRTNSIGYFQLNLYYLPQHLHFYIPGQSLSKVLLNHQSDFVLIELDADNELGEVIVKGKKDSVMVVVGSSKTQIDVQSISEVPSALSSSGVINALKYSTGFQSAVEANNALIVRGGNNDQNLVLFDGVPVYNPLHIPGWFSIFNKNAVSSLNLIKGGISAKYGGRLSSVIQTESKKGNLKSWHGSASLSPFAGEFTLEGPLVKNKLSFIVSGRRTFTDFLVSSVQNLLLPNSTNDFNLYFFDLNVGLRYKISPTRSLDLVSYYGGDRGYIRSRSDIEGSTTIIERNNNELLWSNSLNSLTYRTLLRNRLLATISAKYSAYGFDYQNNYHIQITEAESDYVKSNEVRHKDGIRDFRITSDFNYHVFSGFQLNFGAGYVNYKFVPANTRHLQVINDEPIVDTSLIASEFISDELFGYTEAILQKKKSKLHIGARMVYFKSDKSYIYLEPRLKWAYYPKQRMSFYLAYNALRQNVFSITANDPGLTYSIWLPINDEMEPLEVQQFELGYQVAFRNGPSLQMSSYYKLFKNLPDYQTNISDFIIEKDLTIGSGMAKGLELGIQQELPKFSYWLSYTLAKSTRTFDKINGGEEYPFRFDRRHDASLVSSLKLNNKWRMGITWIYSSGNYVTLPVSRVLVKIDGDLFVIENFDKRNNFQLPDYHRMDIGFSNSKKKKKGVRTWTYTIYNVYNQQNPYYINLSFNSEGTPVLQQVNLLPLLPSIQYAYKF
jgi:hypothetical protein